MKLVVIDRTTSGTGAEKTREAANNEVIVTGARLSETADGLPHLRVEPRVAKGLTITSSADTITEFPSPILEEYETSKVGIKLKSFGGITLGLDFEQDTVPGKEHEWFLKVKLGAGLAFNETSGAIDATGEVADVVPATTTTRGTVIIGNGIDVITTPGATAGTISLKMASASQLGGVKVGSGLTINGEGVLSASSTGLTGGIADRLVRWLTATTVGNSIVQDDGTSVGVGGAPSATYMLAVTGKTTTEGIQLTGDPGDLSLDMDSGIASLFGTSGPVTSGANATLFQFAGELTEAASGTHTRLSLMELIAPTVTGGAAEVEDAITLYIAGAPGATVTGDNAALWVESGLSRFGGQVRFNSDLLWEADNTYDIGTSTVQPRDLWLKRKLTLVADEAPSTGPGSMAPLRVGGVMNSGSYEAAFFGGTVYATDFVLIDGTGSVAESGPPIIVLDETTPLNDVSTPLAQLSFVGAGVTATTTGAGHVVVTIGGGSGGGLATSGTVTANTVPKFAGTAPDWTVTNSSITDSGTDVTVSNPLFAPTAAGATNNTQVATTAFVHGHVVGPTKGGSGVTTAPSTLQILVGQAGGTYALRNLSSSGGTWSEVGSNLVFTVTASGGVSSFNDRTGVVSLLSADVTGALGYTPYSSSNPNGYITAAGTAAAAGQLSSSRTFQLTGDVTGSTSSNLSGGLSINTTLSSTGVTPTTYGSSSSIPVFTVNAQGRITSATSTSISLSFSSITGTIGSAQVSGSYPNITSVGTLTGLNVSGATNFSSTVTVNSTYKVGGLTYSTSDPSSTVGVPDGSLWVVYV